MGYVATANGSILYPYLRDMDFNGYTQLTTKEKLPGGEPESTSLFWGG
jgi:hypothetical protein